jgi:LmbE family N-acetylglucosaminyl deacetylase
MAESLRLLCIFAHPDDESMGMGATLARYAAEGVETSLITATLGQRGWFTEDPPYPGPDALGQIREGELRSAAQVLGIHELILLDYMDGNLAQADPQEIIPLLAGHIRDIRPHVVVTFAPEGQYGHPDHIAVGQFTIAALIQAADSWKVSKLYYMVDSSNFVSAIRDVMGEVTFDVGGQLRNHVGWEEWAVSARIPAGPYWRAGLEASLCHESQLPSLGPLPGMSEEQQEALFGLMGTFVRVYSLVNGGSHVEDDLFEGLR